MSNSQALQHICILRLSAIGDVCHCISVVQSIQRHYPKASITWICGKTESGLISDLPGVEVLVFDKRAGFKAYRDLWAQLRGRRFDVLLHMQLALRASLLSLGIKATQKVGFSWKRAREAQWLFTNRKLRPSQSMHVLDQFAEFASFLDVEKQAPSWNIPLSSSDLDFAKKTVTERSVVICPSASNVERNWLTQDYVSLSDWLSSLGFQVVLCGSPAAKEVALAETIQASCKQPLTNIVGQTSLKQLTAVLRRTCVVVAPDSGPAHIATTQGTPVVGLYAHSNPKRTGPYNSQDYVIDVYTAEAEKQFGKPLEHLAWATRLKGKNLMSKIKLEQVQDKLKSLLSTS
ncbi:glycosyltransferase family 9 protein [Alginatibacterium sediminis]|uniref:glycosyltransferase family 9 protein n=1 Tax=Alginatibacterium sediminis TaxID=2164068 RepID=UPI00268D70DD|nr:glycosyltransferase family 9 protein [Alginatibacterium sediminis]